MNKIKQFLQTKTGLAACAVLVLVVGIGIGSSSSKNPPPVAETATVVASSTPAALPVTQPVATQPAPAKKAPTPAVTTSAPTQPVTQPPVVATPPPAAPVAASWHSAYTTSGSQDSKTPPFALSGAEQRITYSCSVVNGSDTFGSTFNGIIKSTTDRSTSDVFAWSVTCPTSNTIYEYSLPSGQYYLDLGAINSSFSVSVEDNY